MFQSLSNKSLQRTYFFVGVQVHEGRVAWHVETAIRDGLGDWDCQHR